MENQAQIKWSLDGLTADVSAVPPWEVAKAKSEPGLYMVAEPCGKYLGLRRVSNPRTRRDGVITGQTSVESQTRLTLKTGVKLRPCAVNGHIAVVTPPRNSRAVVNRAKLEAPLPLSGLADAKVYYSQWGFTGTLKQRDVANRLNWRGPHALRMAALFRECVLDMIRGGSGKHELAAMEGFVTFPEVLDI